MVHEDSLNGRPGTLRSSRPRPVLRWLEYICWIVGGASIAVAVVSCVWGFSSFKRRRPSVLRRCEKRTYRPRFRRLRCDPAILLAEWQFRESGSRQWWRRGMTRALWLAPWDIFLRRRFQRAGEMLGWRGIGIGSFAGGHGFD